MTRSKPLQLHKKILVVLWTFHKKSDGYSFFLVLLIASKDYVTIAIWGFPGLLALVTRRKANLQSVHIQTSNWKVFYCIIQVMQCDVVVQSHIYYALFAVFFYSSNISQKERNIAFMFKSLLRVHIFCLFCLVFATISFSTTTSQRCRVWWWQLRTSCKKWH